MGRERSGTGASEAVRWRGRERGTGAGVGRVQKGTGAVGDGKEETGSGRSEDVDPLDCQLFV